MKTESGSWDVSSELDALREILEKDIEKDRMQRAEARENALVRLREMELETIRRAEAEWGQFESLLQEATSRIEIICSTKLDELFMGVDCRKVIRELAGESVSLILEESREDTGRFD